MRIRADIVTAVIVTVAGALAAFTAPSASSRTIDRQQQEATTPQNPPLQVPVHPPGSQARYLRYQSYRGERAVEERDPVVEARLAREVARDLFSAGDLDDARDFLTDALAHLPDTGEPLADAIARAELHHGLARIAEAQGDWKRRIRNLLSAEHALRRTLNADHPLVLVARTRAAIAEMEKGVSDRKRDFVLASKRRLERIVRESEERLGPDNPIALKAELVVAVGRAVLGQTGRAIDDIDRIIARIKKMDDGFARTRKVLVAAAMITKARLLHWQGRVEEAAILTDRAAQLAEDLTDRPIRITDFPSEAYATGRAEGQPRRRFGENLSSVGMLTLGNGAFAVTDLGLPGAAGVTARDFSSELSGSWVEISLCIAADGSARDVRMIRYGGSKRWAENATRIVGRYRYLAPKSLVRSDCLPRLLRLAVVSEKKRPTGTHLRLRGENTLIRSFDLLGEDPLKAGYLAVTTRKPPADRPDRKAPETGLPRAGP